MELKRIYSTGTIIIMCVIIATIQAASAAPTISVEPSYQSVSCGDTFTVNITVDPDGNTITGVDYILCFNNTLLNATSLVSGAFFSGYSVNIYGEGINNSAGTIDYCESIIGDGGVTGIGTLTTIAFETIRPGVSNLNFSVVTVVNDTGATDVEIADGTVDIAQSQPPTSFLISGYISYADGSDCNDPNVNITNLNIGKEWTAETDETSNYYQLTLLSCADVIAGEVLRFDAASLDGSQNTTEHTVTQEEVNGGGISNFNITLASSDIAPYLVIYTITNITISPDGDGIMDDTEIKVKFSEPVNAAIKIENASGVVKSLYASSGKVTTPTTKIWDGTDVDDNIVADGTYHVNITMDDGVNPLVYNNTEIITVSTSLDTTPPIITNIANGTPTDSSVTITWTTDEASDSLVKYGTTSGTYADSEPNAAMVTSHSIMLAGLSMSTTYYFVVNSTDASSNSNESEEHSFTTAAESITSPELVSCVITPTPPVVQGINISIDCLFSEAVAYEIRIENTTGVLIEEIGSGTAKDPDPKWWNTTTGTPAGTYIVNVTMDNSTSGLSSYNDTNTIEVIPAEMSTVSIGSAEGSVGDTVNVSINITDALAIGAMDIRVTYNASILNATNVANGSMIESLPAPLVAYHISYVDINVSFITLEAINGDGELFIVTFDVVGGDAGDSSILAIEAEAYTNDTPPQPVDVVTKNGVVNVTDDTADTTPPTVIGNSPTGTGVPVTTDVTITFDEAMNQTSAEDAFSILPDVDGAFSWSGNAMTSTLAADLADNTTYDVTISTDAKDLAGNPLAEPFTWNFTTATVMPTSTTVSIENVTVAPGESVVVPIMVNYVMNLGGCEINMTYNASVVHVTDVTPGDLDLLVSTFDNGSGWMYANAINASGLNGNVVFAYINLTAVGSKGDASLLGITVEDLFDVSYNKITHTVIDGTFTIEADTEPPLVTDASASRDEILNDNGRARASGTNVTILNVTVTDEESDVASVTIDLSSIGGSPIQPMEHITGTDVWTVTTNATDGVNLTHQLTINATDGEGNYNNTVAIELTVLRRGDVCRDNVIDGNDVMYIARYLAGLEPECSSPPTELVLVGDVVGISGDPEGDGIVDLMDAVYIARYGAGLESKP